MVTVFLNCPSEMSCHFKLITSIAEQHLKICSTIEMLRVCSTCYLYYSSFYFHYNFKTSYFYESSLSIFTKSKVDEWLAPNTCESL